MCKLGKKELTKPIIQVIPDFLIIEGPKAGGHLGFSREELENGTAQNIYYDGRM